MSVQPAKKRSLLPILFPFVRYFAGRGLRRFVRAKISTLRPRFDSNGMSQSKICKVKFSQVLQVFSHLHLRYPCHMDWNLGSIVDELVLIYRLYIWPMKSCLQFTLRTLVAGLIAFLLSIQMSPPLVSFLSTALTNGPVLNTLNCPLEPQRFPTTTSHRHAPMFCLLWKYMT